MSIAQADLLIQRIRESQAETARLVKLLKELPGGCPHTWEKLPNSSQPTGVTLFVRVALACSLCGDTEIRSLNKECPVCGSTLQQEDLTPEDHHGDCSTLWAYKCSACGFQHRGWVEDR